MSSTASQQQARSAEEEEEDEEEEQGEKFEFEDSDEEDQGSSVVLPPGSDAPPSTMKGDAGTLKDNVAGAAVVEPHQPEAETDKCSAVKSIQEITAAASMAQESTSSQGETCTPQTGEINLFTCNTCYHIPQLHHMPQEFLLLNW